MTEPGLGSGALREPVAFVIETEGGDLYDRGHVIFSDARQAQDRADDLNSELEKESFRVAPLYREAQASSEIRERVEAAFDKVAVAKSRPEFETLRQTIIDQLALAPRSSKKS